MEWSSRLTKRCLMAPIYEGEVLTIGKTCLVFILSVPTYVLYRTWSLAVIRAWLVPGTIRKYLYGILGVVPLCVMYLIIVALGHNVLQIGAVPPGEKTTVIDPDLYGVGLLFGYCVGYLVLVTAAVLPDISQELAEGTATCMSITVAVVWIMRCRGAIDSVAVQLIVPIYSSYVSLLAMLMISDRPADCVRFIMQSIACYVLLWDAVYTLTSINDASVVFHLAADNLLMIGFWVLLVYVNVHDGAWLGSWPQRFILAVSTIHCCYWIIVTVRAACITDKECISTEFDYAQLYAVVTAVCLCAKLIVSVLEAWVSIRDKVSRLFDLVFPELVELRQLRKFPQIPLLSEDGEPVRVYYSVKPATLVGSPSGFTTGYVTRRSAESSIGLRERSGKSDTLDFDTPRSVDSTSSKEPDQRFSIT